MIGASFSIKEIINEQPNMHNTGSSKIINISNKPNITPPVIDVTICLLLG